VLTLLSEDPMYPRGLFVLLSLTAFLGASAIDVPIDVASAFSSLPLSSREFNFTHPSGVFVFTDCAKEGVRR
jgi:hypothetical protein